MFLLFSSGFAAPNLPDKLHDFWESVYELRLHHDLYRRVESPIRFRDGPLSVTLTDGYLIPVFSGRFAGEWSSRGDQLLNKLRRQDKNAELPAELDRGTKQLVGFVWTKGKGHVVTSMKDRADAQSFANFMVRRVGQDAATVEDVSSSQRFATEATEGLFLSIDPNLVKGFLAQGSGSDDPYEVIVYEDDKPGPAQQRARTLFKQRLALFKEMGVDLPAQLAWDRTAAARGLGDATGNHKLLDVHTTDRYGRVVIKKSGSPTEDEWLSLIRDDTGSLGRWRSTLLSAGRNAGGLAVSGRISGEVFEAAGEDPAAVRQAPVRVDPVIAEATIWAQPSNNRVNINVRIETELEFRAVGGSAQWVDIAVPRSEAVPGSFELLQAIDEAGVDLLTTDREILRVGEAIADNPEEIDDPTGPDDPADDVDKKRSFRTAPDPTEMTGARVRLFLPAPVEAGSTFKVRVSWKDTWPYNNYRACSKAIERPAGASSGLQGFLPSPIHGRPGTPWKFTARIGVPQESKLTSAMSGVTRKIETDDQGWTWTWSNQTEVDALWPSVAVGKWENLYEPAQKGMPAIRTHLLHAYPGQLESFGPEARRVVSYYQRWLPEYPVDEIEVFEAPSSCYTFVWIAPHGMVNLQRMTTGGEINGGRMEKHLESAVFSHELAHQYWGHLAPPASIEDFWIAETFSEGFSCMYVGAAFDPKDCQKKMVKARKYWERDIQVVGGIASLTNAYRSVEKGQIVYQYGPYVFHEMLRRRIGKQAFFSATDLLLRDHAHTPITTERLQAYYEAASGKDLSAFFDYWVHQGLIPAIAATWSINKKVITGTITTDIPFGTFDVPIVVTDATHSESIWVDVVDGKGSFRFEGPWKKPKVQLDPTFATLARKRTIHLQK